MSCGKEKKCHLQYNQVLNNHFAKEDDNMSIGAMMANYTGGFFYTGSFNTKKAEDTSAFEQLAEKKAQEWLKQIYDCGNSK